MCVIVRACAYVGARACMSICGKLGGWVFACVRVRVRVRVCVCVCVYVCSFYPTFISQNLRYIK